MFFAKRRASVETAHADFTYRFRHFPNSRLASNTAPINSSNRSVKKKEKEEKPEKEKVIIPFPLPSLPCVTQQLRISANGGRRHEDGVCRIHSRMPWSVDPSIFTRLGLSKGRISPPSTSCFALSLALSLRR